MTHEELLALRQQLLNDITPLVLEGSGDDTDKFDLLLRLIQSGGASSDVYRRAYESAKHLEDNETKVASLLALLDEVDFEISNSQEGELADGPAAGESNESSATPNTEPASDQPSVDNQG